MNRLSISEFTDFADAFVHANTPISLLNGLVRSSGMRKLRERDINVLLQRCDEVTARPKRNAYIMGLAYAILCAILLHARESSDKINFDETRLDWGQAIRAYVSVRSLRRVLNLACLAWSLAFRWARTT